MPDEARVGRDRWTIGEVCRRLTRAGEVTRRGKTIGERRVWEDAAGTPAATAAGPAGAAAAATARRIHS